MSTERPCAYCSHPFSMHFSDDTRGLGSKDSQDVHKGCSAMQNGAPCPCPGFAASLPEDTISSNSSGHDTGAGIS